VTAKRRSQRAAELVSRGASVMGGSGGGYAAAPFRFAASGGASVMGGGRWDVQGADKGAAWLPATGKSASGVPVRPFGESVACRWVSHL
jgi:hypothetical protein